MSKILINEWIRFALDIWIHHDLKQKLFKSKCAINSSHMMRDIKRIQFMKDKFQEYKHSANHEKELAFTIIFGVCYVIPHLVEWLMGL